MNKLTGLSFALIPVCGLALSACGGGGSGGGESYSPVLFAPDIDDASAVAIAGGSPLDLSSQQIKSEYEAIVDGSDRILISKIITIQDLGPEYGLNAFKTDASCNSEGNSCTYGVNRLLYNLLEGPQDENDNGSVRPLDVNFHPLMVKNGIPLAESIATYPDRYNSSAGMFGYGGWMDHSVFGVYLYSEVDADIPANNLWFGYSIVAGNATGTNPSDGPFTWAGVMVGRYADFDDEASDFDSDVVGNAVQGDALISIMPSNADQSSVDVAFSNIRNLKSGQSIEEFGWSGLSVSGGYFESRDRLHEFGAIHGVRWIQGAFYGPKHEEVAGVFEGNNVLGAFGAKR